VHFAIPPAKAATKDQVEVLLPGLPLILLGMTSGKLRPHRHPRRIGRQVLIAKRQRQSPYGNLVFFLILSDRLMDLAIRTARAARVVPHNQ